MIDDPGRAGFGNGIEATLRVRVEGTDLSATRVGLCCCVAVADVASCWFVLHHPQSDHCPHSQSHKVWWLGLGC